MNILMRIIRYLIKHVKIIVGREIRLTPRVHVDTEFHGSTYGGWAILKNSLNEHACVISVGIGEDASFDLSLIEKYRCQIFAFDPTPKSCEWVRNNIVSTNFHHESIALGESDGTIRLYMPKKTHHVSASCRQSEHTQDNYFEAPCLRISTLLSRYGCGERVDVLKMDIEGAEYGVIRDMIKSGAYKLIDQLLIEFHHHFSNFSISETLEAVAILEQAGLRIAWVSDSGHEVLFVKHKKSK